MVRNRERKTDRGLHSDTNMREAVDLVEGGMSLRVVADLKNVKCTTLHRYVQKKKEAAEGGGVPIPMTPNYAVRRIFSSELEVALEQYLVTCSKMCYGLDTVETRRLAYDMAKFHNLNIPNTWKERQMAGIDWLYGFRKRHPEIRLRKPEACSLSRATSFNRHNVQMFFDNLFAILQRNPSFGDGTRVFSLDETGTSTVQKPKKVFASKSTRQLNKVTSAERGTLVTTCCIVSASGSALPPAMVFPRKNFKNYMLSGAPAGTIGLAQPTGWMIGELFQDVMKHFVKMTSSTKENPTLVIMDNHESHLAPAVLNTAKENGVILLTIPPHTSHKLQALDVAVFGPFQTFYNAAADSWMIRHPGQTLSIYNVAELVGQAFEKAMTPSNIKSGFKKTGICPFDRDIFTEDQFLTSEVTNRQLTEEHQELQSSGLTTPIIDAQRPSTSRAALQAFENQIKSPLECRDYPRAGPRKNVNKRKRGKSVILTDTPVKNEIEERAREREEKKNKKAQKLEKSNNIRKVKTEKVTKVLDFFSPIANLDANSSSTESSDNELDLPVSTFKTPKANDFVLVKFSQKQIKYFVGRLITDIDENNECDVSYMRQSTQIDNSFYFPLEPDLAVVSISDIELVLPSPSLAGKTKRQSNIYSFPKKLISKYNLG